MYLNISFVQAWLSKWVRSTESKCSQLGYARAKTASCGLEHFRRSLCEEASAQLQYSQPQSSYLLGLLAMIKCSICSYQCDSWYGSHLGPTIVTSIFNGEVQCQRLLCLSSRVAPPLHWRRRWCTLQAFGPTIYMFISYLKQWDARLYHCKRKWTVLAVRRSVELHGASFCGCELAD